VASRLSEAVLGLLVGLAAYQAAAHLHLVVSARWVVAPLLADCLAFPRSVVGRREVYLAFPQWVVDSVAALREV